jgi:hypothetical protein
LLEAFFQYDSNFFLTGGAALAGFHLGHRTTDDLDLFTTTASMDDGVHTLKAAVSDIGGTMESVMTSPDFRRFIVRCGQDSLVVDLAIDRAPQGTADKLLVGRVRVDSAEEILANKLCTLLSRGEIRDIVDVLRLEETGLDLIQSLELARQKDGGLTSAQLAWVISQIQIGDDAKIPSGLSPTDVRQFLREFEKRLKKAAFPKDSSHDGSSHSS